MTFTFYWSGTKPLRKVLKYFIFLMYDFFCSSCLNEWECPVRLCFCYNTRILVYNFGYNSWYQHFYLMLDYYLQSLMPPPIMKVMKEGTESPPMSYVFIKCLAWIGLKCIFGTLKFTWRYIHSCKLYII